MLNRMAAICHFSTFDIIYFFSLDILNSPISTQFIYFERVAPHILLAFLKRNYKFVAHRFGDNSIYVLVNLSFLQHVFSLLNRILIFMFFGLNFRRIVSSNFIVNIFFYFLDCAACSVYHYFISIEYIFCTNYHI